MFVEALQERAPRGRRVWRWRPMVVLLLCCAAWLVSMEACGPEKVGSEPAVEIVAQDGKTNAEMQPEAGPEPTPEPQPEPAAEPQPEPIAEPASEPPKEAGPEPSTEPAVDAAPDEPAPVDAMPELPGESAGCPRVPGNPEAARYLVVSHPYDAQRNKVGVFEVLELSSSGQLKQINKTFTMGVSTLGKIHFTPDGKIGMLVQEQGTIGVFRLDVTSSGLNVVVVHQAFKGSFYAGSLAISPKGDEVYVADPNWRNNGGGLFRVAIGCDGTLKERGRMAQSKLLYSVDLHPTDPTRAVVSSHDIASSPANTSAHEISVLPQFGNSSSADAFGDLKFITSSSAVTADGKFVLIGDNNAFSGLPNRIAIVEWANGGLKKHKVITPFDDPIEILASPYNNALLLASGLKNGFFKLPYNPGGSPPFGAPAVLSYKNGKPPLPGKGVVITRGNLKGRAFVSVNTGIHQLQFETNGDITDLGAFSFGSGLTNVVGAIGVQP